MTMIFRFRTIEGIEGRPALFVHTMPHGDGIGVEFHNNGAMLTRERFEEMVAWVRTELDGLEQQARLLRSSRFIN